MHIPHLVQCMQSCLVLAAQPESPESGRLLRVLASEEAQLALARNAQQQATLFPVSR